MQTLNEQLKAHSLAKYIRLEKDKEQFKLYLKQPYQGLVVWKDNPNESSMMTISVHKPTQPRMPPISIGGGIGEQRGENKRILFTLN